jgi:hypothetical protein
MLKCDFYQKSPDNSRDNNPQNSRVLIQAVLASGVPARFMAHKIKTTPRADDRCSA